MDVEDQDILRARFVREVDAFLRAAARGLDTARASDRQLAPLGYTIWRQDNLGKFFDATYTRALGLSYSEKNTVYDTARGKVAAMNAKLRKIRNKLPPGAARAALSAQLGVWADIMRHIDALQRQADFLAPVLLIEIWNPLLGFSERGIEEFSIDVNAALFRGQVQATMRAPRGPVPS